MNIDFPYHFNQKGRTAQTEEDAHIRDLIEQILFTSPGERVNRPEFGSGLLQTVFQPNSSELATATEFMVQGALQQWLGDLIRIESVKVENEDSSLRVTVSYIILRNNEPKVSQFTRGQI